MFALNGVPLDNPAYGWLFRGPSKPLSKLVKRIVAVQRPDRDGQATVSQMADAVPLMLLVQTPREHYEDLLVLVDSVPLMFSRVAVPTREVGCTAQSSDYDGYGDADAILDVTILISLDGPHWRDTADSTVEVTLTASTMIDCFPSMSAPIGDGLVRVIGPTSTVQISNPATGATVVYATAIPVGKALLYDMDDQSATVVNSTGWAGGTDVSGDLELQGPRLTVTPVLTDPATRTGQLKVDATGMTSSSKVAVKGKGAYLVG